MGSLCSLNLFVPDTTGFFVKHVKTGMCINDTSTIAGRGPWGNMSYLELSNNCLDPAAQFRFVDTSAMLNLKRPGCLHPAHIYGRLDLLVLWVASVSEIEKGNSCYQKLAINQTSWGGLSLQNNQGGKLNFETWCAVPKTDQPLSDNQGIDPYFGLTQNCSDAKNKRFNFGKFLVSSHTLPFYDIKQKLYTVYEIKCSSMHEKLLYCYTQK